MDIKEIKKYLPDLTDEELKEISSRSFQNLFNLYTFSGNDLFFLKNGYIYKVIDGEVIISGYHMEKELEVNMNFKKGEHLGLAGLLEEEIVDFVVRGFPKAKLLELPVRDVLEEVSPRILLGVYKNLTTSMINNLFKFFSVYAAKVNFSNDQFFINFLLEKDGTYEYTTTESLAQLLHIDLRTIQRIIKRFIEKKIIKKNGKIITIIDIEEAKKLLEI